MQKSERRIRVAAADIVRGDQIVRQDRNGMWHAIGTAAGPIQTIAGVSEIPMQDGSYWRVRPEAWVAVSAPIPQS